MNTTYCGNYPDQDHTECPSSTECFHAVPEAVEPALGELPISELLSAAFGHHVSVRRVSHKRDAIQSFTVGPRNADRAAQVLAGAGYFVHGADNYVVHLIP